MTVTAETFFTKQILSWAKDVHRPLPWKFSGNPYHILLSEFILQQTRVEQGKPYFKKFIDHFPTIQDLAKASETEVLKLWQGLGYYSRARNLHKTAQQITEDYQGQVPRTPQELKTLKGVGDYTAAAIASFAYNYPSAVVDGNVYRVLSRYFALETDFYQSKGKAKYTHLAQDLLDLQHPAFYNQAIMDFGAIQCKPQSPNCFQCVLNPKCKAFQQNAVNLFPPPKRKINKKIRFFHYLVIMDESHQVLIKKRDKKDIWQSLHDFPLVESHSDQRLPDSDIVATLKELKIESNQNSYKLDEAVVRMNQTLTHQKIHSIFYQIRIQEHERQTPPQFLLNPKNLSKFAFPKTIDCYLKDNYLNLYIKNSYSW